MRPTMRPQRVLVTGCARSGTGYLAALLGELGVACGHERVYEPRTVLRAGAGNAAPSWPDTVRAESSWLAAPYLASLPADTAVVHLVRHPLAVMRSNLRIGFFASPSEYLDHACAYVPGLLEGQPIERAARYWTGWNALIEREARRAGIQLLVVRLERLDERGLRELCGDLELGLSPARARAALARVPADTNTRGRRDQDRAIQVADLTDDALRGALERSAQRYGYADVDSPFARSCLPESLGSAVP
jgi:hypothetical protein